MAINLRLEGAPELTRALLRSPEALAAAQSRAMTRSLLLVEADARRNVRHDTRRLMNSMTHEQHGRGTSLTGRVGPSVQYGLYVERGRLPNKPPPPKRALRGWARRHGIPESALYVVARAIGRRGIKARPFLVPAYLRNAERIVRLFADAGAGVVAVIGRRT